jgi:hypothetical protein
MNMRTLFLTFALSALAACSQPAETPARAPSAPPPAPMAQSTGGPCPTVEALTDTVGFETLGTVSGYTITAEPRTLACSEEALGSVECAVTGPTAIRVEQSATSFTNYTLAAGQSGTLVVGPNGPQCHLNANGG